MSLHVHIDFGRCRGLKFNAYAVALRHQLVSIWSLGSHALHFSGF